MLSSCNKEPCQLTAGNAGEHNTLIVNSECGSQENGNAPGSDLLLPRESLRLVFNCIVSCKWLPPHRIDYRTCAMTGQA